MTAAMSAAVCSVENCNRFRARGKGLCSAHYTRLRRHGDVDALRPVREAGTVEICSVEGCGSSARAKHLCSTHYSRLLRFGHVDAANPVRHVEKHDRFRDKLPAGYWSDVSVVAPGAFGAVVVCEACGAQLGPVFSPIGAATAIHEHQLQAHTIPGRHRATAQA